MLRANKMTTVCENNWCTPDWKTFTDDSTNGAFNFLSILPASEDNAGIFEDLANFDLRIKAGTSVRTNAVGDPRWLK